MRLGKDWNAEDSLGKKFFQSQLAAPEHKRALIKKARKPGLLTVFACECVRCCIDAHSSSTSWNQCVPYVELTIVSQVEARHSAI